MNTLEGKVIVITGAGGTIAGATEEALVDAGARPILVDRDPLRIEARARAYVTEPVQADLLTLADARAMVAAAREQMGRIDGLVHLVGEVVAGDFADDPADDDAFAAACASAFASNAHTLANAVRAVLPELRRQPEAFVGGIAAPATPTCVAGSSTDADGDPQGGALTGADLFAAAKQATAALLRSLDHQLRHSRIQVGIVVPMGVVDTVANRRKHPGVPPATLIKPAAIGEAFVRAASSGAGGRLLELAIHPPRG